MEESVIAILLLILTGAATFQGLRDSQYFDRYAFDVDGILIDRQRYRLFSSGLLHLDWIHFAFNMYALLSFSAVLEYVLGPLQLAVLYLASLLGGSLLSLYVHRNHGDYRAAGASGAVSGVVFASILLFPTDEISLFLLPFGIDAWLLGLLFVVLSIIGTKRDMGNIGHDAHLGGAVTGMLLVLAFRPDLAFAQPWVVALLLLPGLLFIGLIIRNPNVLILKDYWGETAAGLRQLSRRPPRPPRHTPDSQAEIDRILDKIRTNGIDSLSERERRILDEQGEG
jgi:membrane associated rhomboid family serine protease